VCSSDLGTDSKPENKAKKHAVKEHEKQKTPPPAKVFCMADVVRESVDWLWHPNIPFGKLTSIEGDPGVGKSTITTAIAAAISKGEPLPGVDTRRKPENVLMLTAEDGLGDTLRPRLDAIGADPNRIFGAETAWTLDDSGIAALQVMIDQYRPKLVIIDPIVAFMGGKMDMNKANQVRPMMAKLSETAHRNALAIVIVRHLTKDEKSRAIYRGQGSVDITAACRSVLMVGSDPTDENRRFIAHAKSNLAKRGPSWGYTITDGCFRWTGVVDLSAEDMNRSVDNNVLPGARDEAINFLEELLKDGPVTAREGINQAKEQDIAKRTLDRAKTMRGVKSVKHDGQWLWVLCKSETQSQGGE